MHAVKSDGQRCESPKLTSSGYSYPHDPRRAFEDDYQLSLEATAPIKTDATACLSRIYDKLDKAMRQLERGDLDSETAMAQLARTMCEMVEIDESTSQSTVLEPLGSLTVDITIPRW